MDIPGHITRLYAALWWRLYKRFYFWQFTTLAEKGAWRDATVAALSMRRTDTVLEIPVTTKDGAVPLFADVPSINDGVLSSRISPLGGKHISFINERFECDGGSYDNVVCCLALHTLMPPRNVALLKELRRVLRQHGTLYVVEFDQPLTKVETLALRGSGILFEKESADVHHEGTIGRQLELIGFSGVKRI